MINDKFFNLFEEGLKTISACPVCSSRYEPLEAKILIEREEAHLISIKCRNCQAIILAVILTNNLGITSVGLVTDLDGAEVLKFSQAEPVSYNDVIATHQALSSKEALINCFN